MKPLYLRRPENAGRGNHEYYTVRFIIFNLIIARCTKYKHIFLTGHHSFFLACLFSAVLQAAEFQGWMLILIGGFLLGSWSAISPAIGQRYTVQVTEDGGIAMGHFCSLGYYPLGMDRQPDRQSGKFLRRYRNFRKVGLSARYQWSPPVS
ncbi:hypothetical protein MJ560_06440 [Klebsiella pneumoniae]|nr:hypothetical protein MJ560_06440 [Klebsiella pneumoniae]